jgi:hypothetical protein
MMIAMRRALTKESIHELEGALMLFRIGVATTVMLGVNRFLLSKRALVKKDSFFVRTLYKKMGTVLRCEM